MQSHQFGTIVLIQVLTLLATTTAIPLNVLQLYLDSASNPDKLQMTGTLPRPNEEDLVYMPEGELVYIPKDSGDNNDKSTRPRRHLSGTGQIQYQNIWPLLNAAKDRAVQLAKEGSRRKYGRARQSITKRQWEIPEERLARYSRNLPQEKLYQLQTVGELPMFRFG